MIKIQKPQRFLNGNIFDISNPDYRIIEKFSEYFPIKLKSKKEEETILEMLVAEDTEVVSMAKEILMNAFNEQFKYQSMILHRQKQELVIVCIMRYSTDSEDRQIKDLFFMFCGEK